VIYVGNFGKDAGDGLEDAACDLALGNAAASVPKF